MPSRLRSGAPAGPADVCRRLGIEDFAFVEIESKRRVEAEDAKPLRNWLLARRNVHHKGRRSFYDQFLDTPAMELHQRGVSLRLRYKDHGANVYLQYKGPGFLHRDILFRSEYSSGRLEGLGVESSHHRLVHVTHPSIQDLLMEQGGPDMIEAMRRHLGDRVVARISHGPILCMYQKDKFHVDLGTVHLEPSVDRVVAFYVNPKGPHLLSSFSEYENEIKDGETDPAGMLERLDDLTGFDAKVRKRFRLPPDRLDKYHRSVACFRDVLPRPR